MSFFKPKEKGYNHRVHRKKRRVHHKSESDKRHSLLRKKTLEHLKMKDLDALE